MSWIPCTESLPEMKDAGKIFNKFNIWKRSKECLLTLQDKSNGSKVVVSKAYFQDGKWISDSFEWLKATKCDFEILAWQYLPEPY